MEKDSIKLKQSVIHILDINNGIPILSDSSLELNEDLRTFIISHIFKIISGDDFKRCDFLSTNGTVIETLKNYNSNNFITMSKQLATHLFNIMKKNVDIPSADIIFTIFEVNQEPHLAILKMNYKSSFIHYVDNNDTAVNNSIIKQKTVLPSEGQKLDEAIIISLDDYSIKLIEKKYEINGNKEFYLSRYFLECKWDYSSKAKLNILTKTVDQLNKQYFDDDVHNKVKFKEALVSDYEENGAIYVDKVADKVFESNVELKEEFKEKLDKYGLINQPIDFQTESITKKIEKQRIQTDTGIELKIPVELYNKDIEFINNTDGTISITIKNISKLIGK